jgi:hypothetical protein
MRRNFVNSDSYEVYIGKNGGKFYFDKEGYQNRGSKNNDLSDSTLFDDVYFKRTQKVSDRIAKFGSDNKLPYKIIKWIIDSPLLLPLLSFKIDMVLGQGLYVYKIVGYEQKGNDVMEIREPLLDNQIIDFFAENETDDFFEGASTDFYFFGNFFAEYIASRGAFVEGYTKGIALLNHIDFTNVRPEIPEDFKTAVQTYILNPDWNNYQISNNSYIPSFSKAKIRKKSIEHIKAYFPGNPFMSVPFWIGANQFIEYLNSIPTFKKSLINHVATPSWHVKIPADYFKINFPNYSKEDLMKEKEKLSENLEKFLQGPENAGKPLITYFWKDTSGKEVSIEISPIKHEIPDTLFSDDFEQMFQILCSATQVPPSLASMLVPGKLSSGSDILNSWNAYNARIDRHRKKILKPLYNIKKINGWNPEAQFAFRNKELKTTDQNPTGQTNNF